MKQQPSLITVEALRNYSIAGDFEKVSFALLH
jgi:hypothetical protein